MAASDPIAASARAHLVDHRCDELPLPDERVADEAAPGRGADPRVRGRELRFLDALRRGDQRAFEQLVVLHHGGLMRAARVYVRSYAAAEEVVQDTWAGALRNLPGFAGRSSLRTWLHRIMANQAIDYVRREGRSLPFCVIDARESATGRRIDPLSELLATQTAAPWSAQLGGAQPEARLLGAEQRSEIAAAIAVLPPRQRLVIALRDVEGCSAAEAAQALGISTDNQRVLLHRARATVRDALLAHRDGQTRLPVWQAP